MPKKKESPPPEDEERRWLILTKENSSTILQKTCQRGESPIIAGYSIYRDARFLRSSLDSICHYVDVVCLLLGRALDSPELPEDNTQRIISETASRFDPQFYLDGGNPQKFIIFPTDPIAESEKRALFFKLIRPGGYLFTIEPNEVSVGDVKAGLDFVRENDPIKAFWVFLNEWGWQPRIVRVEEGMYPLPKIEDPESAKIDTFRIVRFTKG